MSAPDPDFQSALDEFKKGGWIVSLLGAAGAIVAILSDEKSYPWAYYVKKIIAGGLMGVIMFFAMHNADISPFIKSLVMCMSGAVSLDIYKLTKRIIKNLWSE